MNDEHMLNTVAEALKHGVMVVHVVVEPIYQSRRVLSVHLTLEGAKAALVDAFGIHPSKFMGTNPECWWVSSTEPGGTPRYELYHICDTGWFVESHTVEK